MATRIYDIAYPTVPDDLCVPEGYDMALFLVRVHGVPAGTIELPVHEGRVDRGELTAQMRLKFGVRAGLSAPEAPRDCDACGQFSILICSRERPDDLERCLSALMALRDKPLEIILIDNDPVTDGNRNVAERFPGVRYVCEPRRGLDNARNRAIREARGAFVAFIDDDAVADPLWLRGLAMPYADPRVQCVTGLTMPLELETDAQILFEKITGFSLRGFERRVFRSPPGDCLAVGGVGAGANMSFRRSIFDVLGPFDPALDAGPWAATGGDHEYFSRILRNGDTIVYTPAALNWHKHRRTYAELRKTMRNYGNGVFAFWTSIFLSKRDMRVIRKAASWMFRYQVPDLVRAFLRRDPQRPFDLLWAQFIGCFTGTYGYLLMRRAQRRLDIGE